MFLFCLKTAADGCETLLPAVLGLPPQAVPSLRPLPAALIRKLTSQLLRIGAHTRNRCLIPAVRVYNGKKPETGNVRRRCRPATIPKAFQAGQSRGSGRHTVRPGMSLHTMEGSLRIIVTDCTQCQHKCRKKCCAQSAWRERRFVSCDREQRTWASPSGGALKPKHTPSIGYYPAAYHMLSGTKCGALSAVRRCLASGIVLYPPALGIIKRTPEKRKSFFTG